MIPVVLVTGFLGSGKTTFLRRVAEKESGRRLAFLVNEFSERDIDGRLLAMEGRSVVSLAGGSIFCRCMLSSFVSVLKSLAHREQTIDGVVIESSGIADPRVITRLMEEHKLDREFVIRSIIAIIDPGSFPKLLKTLPNVVAQVEASGAVLVNRSDLFPREAVESVAGQVRDINPAADIVYTEFAEFDFDIFEAGYPAQLAGEYALCRDPNYESFAVEFQNPISDHELEAFFNEHASDIFRAKGTVPLDGQNVYADYSQAGLRLRSNTHWRSRSLLVLIVRGGSAPRIEGALNKLGCEKISKPAYA